MNRPLSPQGWAIAPDPAQPPPEALPPDVIRGQLDRILASVQFRDSLRLSRFLSFVVATALTGKTDCLKAYTIATEALGRDSDFDPQNDPIVRVEAGRLRQALGRYYAKAGRDDPVLIDMPRGSYVPSFQRRSAPPQQPPDRDASPTPDGAASAASAQATKAAQLGRTPFDGIEMFKAQQGEMAELSGAMRSVRQTLQQSRDLLKESAQIDFGRCSPAAEPASTPAGDNSGDTSGASARDDARFSPLASQQPPPELPEALPLRHVRSLIVRLTGRTAAKARIFKIAFAAVAVLAILEVVFDIDHPLVGGPNHGLWQKPWPAWNAAASQPPGAEDKPTIYVEPVTAVGEQTPGFMPAKMIRERLINALARYDDATVVTDRPAIGTAASQPPVSSIYRLAGTVRYDGRGALLFVQLIDTANDAIVWTRQYDHPIKPDPHRQNGLIALDVARTLLDPFGVVQARERVKLATADPTKHTYVCILDANEYLRSFNPSEYQPVHDCLLHASERTPPAVTVFADLAFVYLRNYRFGIGAPPGDATTLDNAYAMAARAVDIKPDSAFAQYALGSVLMAKGDMARAKIASDKSYALNPDDGAVAFGRATMLVLTGNVDAGLALLDKNAIKSSNGWFGYHTLKALGCYLEGDLNTAAAESKQIANPFFPPGLMLDALIANKAGDRARAQQDIAMLYQFYPAWQQNLRASIARFLPQGPMADRLAADFKAAAADTLQ